MNKLITISLLSLIFSFNIYAYADMSDTAARAAELNMNNQDYNFSMAFAGLLAGSMFGLFLWKTK